MGGAAELAAALTAARNPDGGWGYRAGKQSRVEPTSFALLALATAALLLLYEGARRSYKSGENRTEQQQVVRIAFDKLSSDLRLAGYNHNPDGRRDRPDEAIEAAFDTAIIIRADFDALDPDEALDPERELARTGTGGFRVVSTGNDEIVAALGRAPDWVLVPVGGGGTLFGIWRGFTDLLRLKRIRRVPRMVAVQPARFNTLEQALANINRAEDRLRVAVRHHLETLGRDRALAVVSQVELRHSLKFMSLFSQQEVADYLGVIRKIVEHGQELAHEPEALNTGKPLPALRRARACDD